jgi:hypothetical protein
LTQRAGAVTRAIRASVNSVVYAMTHQRGSRHTPLIASRL